ncbi:DUF3194 domain-containing protein [Halobacteriaceae archaeon SHR40]|uniref:DUF3194 domain-containing protein n=1 Tax=Halovenus amylolytica TaxID=2500550 RepID=UPI000FE3DFF4
MTAVDDTEVVQTAAAAAEEVIFSRYSRSEVHDFDITATFEDGEFELDVYLDVPDDRQDSEQVAQDAVLAARSAVDELLAEE